MPRPEPNMTRADYLQMHRERRDLIVSAVKAGKTYAEIGETFCISRARVSQIAAGAGITRKRGVNRSKP